MAGFSFQNAQLDAIEVALRNGVRATLQGLAGRTYDVSQGLVPVDTGALKKTGEVSPIEQHGNVAAISVSYGGKDDVGYAVFVHEILENRHAAPTQAKYLEAAAATAVENAGRMAVASFRTAMRGVGSSAVVRPDSIKVKL